MNKQQIKGSANETAGKLEKNLGKATANGTLQVKGAARELAGKAQKSVGNAKEDMALKKRAKEKGDREMVRDIR